MYSKKSKSVEADDKVANAETQRQLNNGKRDKID